MPSKVELKDLTVTFRGEHGEVLALKDVTFDVEPGEFVTVLGPSGCGKSTLIRTIAGFQPLDAGEILLGGRPVERPGPDRIMVFQEFDQLFPWRTILGNVVFALRLKGVPSSERQPLAHRFLSMVGLDGFERAFPHQLSGGMKQRAAIARSLALDPEILLMDEPFGSLDAQTRAILQTELVRIWQEIGSTIIFITHNIQESILLGSRILVLSARPGRIKADLANALPRPRMPETPEFMDLWRELYAMLEVHRFGENGLQTEPGA